MYYNDKRRSNSSSTSSGMTLGGVVFVVFLILKLTNLIDWSWWWIVSPLWISAGFAFVLMLGLFLYSLLTLGKSRTTSTIGASLIILIVYLGIIFGALALFT
jgi:hypothetical protein